VDVTEVRRLESLRREFVANVSHEPCVTPVTAVRSAAETLQNAASDEPAARSAFLGIIERNAERLPRPRGGLARSVAHRVARAQANMEPLVVDAVYDQVLSLFAERAAKRGTLLENEAPEDMRRILATAVRSSTCSPTWSTTR